MVLVCSTLPNVICKVLQSFRRYRWSQLLYFNHVLSVLWMYSFAIPWVGLGYVIVLLSGHTHFCYLSMYLSDI